MNNKNGKKIEFKMHIFRILSCLIIYGLFGVLSFSYFRSYLTLLFVIVIAVLAILSIVFLVILTGRISFDFFVSNEYLEKGDILSLGIVVNNKSFFSSLKCRCYVQIKNIYTNEADEMVFTIPVTALSEKNYNFSFKTYDIGEVNINISKIELYDLFANFCFIFRGFNEYLVTVLPNKDYIYLDTKYLAMESLTDNDNQNIKGAENSDSFDIRNYIPGDRIKDIHWKLSVKKSELLVKEREHISDNKILIWIDSSSAKRMCEAILSLSYGLIMDICNDSIPVCVYWYDYNVNSVAEYIVLKNTDLPILFKHIYEGGHGDSVGDIKPLLSVNGIDGNSVVRIGLQDLEAKVMSYDI